MYYPTEQAVAGPSCSARGQGRHEICILAHGGVSCLGRGGAHWLTACPRERSWWRCFPRERRWTARGSPARGGGGGRQKEDRSGFLRATSNRFPGKTYLHMQDSATSYLSEQWRVCIEQMDNFFRSFLQKFQPIKERFWVLLNLLLFKWAIVDF